MTQAAPNGNPNPGTPRPTPNKKLGSSKRVTRRLVVMSSAAILAVYAAGYLRTESAAEQLANPAQATARPTLASTLPPNNADLSAESDDQDNPPPTIAPADPTPNAAAPSDDAAMPSDAAPTPAAVADASSATAVPTPLPTATATAARLRDGSYVGTGSSRHGDVEATVVIKGGRIVSANINSCMTRYPCSVIAALPDQVVQQQSESVDLVSRATDSSMAYQEAVANALAKAQRAQA